MCPKFLLLQLDDQFLVVQLDFDKLPHAPQ